VTSVRTAVRGDDYRVVMDVAAPVTAKGFTLDPVAPHGHRLVIDLLGPGKSAPEEPALAMQPQAPEGKRHLVIAIDAGHGGEDPGAIGPGRIMEKQVTLNIARSEDEAERQARGEDVTVVKEEGVQLETFNPDALFDEEALARQRGEEEQPEVPDRA